MSLALHDAALGAKLQEMRLAVLSNNLANLNTIGFKEDRPSFQISQFEADREAAAPIGDGGLAEEMPLEKKTNFSAGLLRNTGNRLDIALEGKGFFCVKTPDGISYTRKGNFNLSPEGTLITQEGFPVLGKRDEIKIGGDGVVTVDETGGVHAGGTQVETFRIVEFRNPDGLVKTGNSLFTPTENAGDPVPVAETTRLHQGFVELSNVEAVKTMVELIDLMRGYESYQKIIQSYNEVNGKAINEIGRVE